MEMVTVTSSMNGYGELVNPWGQILVVVQQSRFTTNTFNPVKGKGKGFG